MPGTYSQLLYHVVFSTKGRRALIKPDLQSRIFEYLGGIIRGEGGTPLQIGGMPDHVHLLFRWKTDDSLANLMRNLKCNSSGWIHETMPALEGFSWQEGYAAFTVSPPQKPAVEEYITNQPAHHQGRSFEDELVELLKKHGIDYDPRYLLD